VVVGR